MLTLPGSSQCPVDTSCKGSSLTVLLCFLDIEPGAQNMPLKKQSLDLNPRCGTGTVEKCRNRNEVLMNTSFN